MYRGTMEYLVPASEITFHIERTVENLFGGVSSEQSKIRIHLDGEPTNPRGFITDPPRGKVAVTTWADGTARGPATTRNLLARESRADYLVFVDSDVILPDTFDSDLRAEISRAGDVIIYPRILGRRQSFWVSHFFQEHVMAPKLFGNGTMGITSAVFGLRRELWQRLPGFDEAFVEAGGEDYKFFRQIQYKPYSAKIFFVEQLRAVHENPTGLQTMLDRARRYGRQAHLHTAPPNMAPGRAMRVALMLGNGCFQTLRGFNQFVASWAQAGSVGRSAARLAVGIRDSIVWTVRMVRQNSIQPEKANLSALLVERIRYSDVMSEVLNKISNRGLQSKNSPSRPLVEPQEAVEPFVGRGRTLHSPHHSFFHIPIYFLLRLLWALAYRRSWLDGHNKDKELGEITG